MTFNEIPVDTELIKKIFSGSPIVTYYDEVREDFETYHSEVFVGNQNTEENNVESLSFYKTELFRSYCMGLLSSISKDSKFNQKISDVLSRQN